MSTQYDNHDQRALRTITSQAQNAISGRLRN